MLSARNVRHRYADRLVLDIDALDLEPGTITALVGPNGAGKTTLLRILACVERPTAGSVSVMGEPATSRAAARRARRRVTLVEQHPLLFRGTVQHNLVYALSLHGLRGTDAARRAGRALERVGVEALAPRDARTLSEGETQRVAVARALSLEPAVVLLDEPVSAADRAAAAQLYRVLEEERARGLAVCFASHQLEDAYRWSDRLLSLVNGRAVPATPENAFRTEVPPGSGTRRVRVGPIELQVVTDREGPATVAVPPEDIVLSRLPLHSSARNEFRGRVTRIAEDGHGGVAVTVDVGVDLVARVTPAALTDLEIVLGSDVVVAVKAMAVRVF